jgi:hypothetical protein
MNKELIQKLFSKSCWDEQAEVDIEDFISVEKFAELIVKECIDIVKPTQHHEAFAQRYLGDVDGLELLDGKVKQIQKHFGVN